MRYVQLRAFHHVALCGGFSRAAERLFLTQPAVSDQVRKLEEEYDMLLFNRLKKQITLTPAGERLLEITRRLFDSEQQAEDLMSQARTLRGGTLCIMADSAHQLLHVLARFREHYPGVRVSIRSGNTAGVVDGLFRYDADPGVLGEIPEGREFETVHLSATPVAAFVARGHPAAGTARIALADLAAGVPRTRIQDPAQAGTGRRRRGRRAEPGHRGRGARGGARDRGGVGFVSAAEFGTDARLVAIPIAGAEASVMMDEALICLRERRGGRLVRAFFEIARPFALPGAAGG